METDDRERATHVPFSDLYWVIEGEKEAAQKLWQELKDAEDDPDLYAALIRRAVAAGRQGGKSALTFRILKGAIDGD